MALTPLLAAFGGVSTGSAVWEAESGAARAEAAHHHQVAATTVGEAVRTLPSRSGHAPQAVAQAVWEYPAGHRHTGSVTVPPGTPVGGKVTLRVDDQGAESWGPRTSGEIASGAVAAGAGAFGVIVLSAMGVVHVRLRLVEARSLARWEREWDLVEPRWSGRLRREPGAEDED